MSPTRDFAQYRRKQIAELRPWQPGDDMAGVSISEPDKQAGSPKVGDMIARNPKNHEDQWLVAAQYFADNFETLSPQGEAKPVGFTSQETLDYFKSPAHEAHSVVPLTAEKSDTHNVALYASPPDARREALKEAAQFADARATALTAASYPTGTLPSNWADINKWRSVAAAIRALADASNPTGAK